MYDQFNRKISYLRISVTDRCNLRCSYCVPACEIKYIQDTEILTAKEIVDVVRTGVSFGINKVRLTGGEPLVRKDIVSLVYKLNKIDGLIDLAMTTNGILLEQMAIGLKEAGLDRINISLDTIDEQRYKNITRGGDINKVIKGIEAAKKAGLEPVKINAVVQDEFNKEIKDELENFCKLNNLELRFIRQMNLKNGEYYQVDGGDGGNCVKCNRIRLTANGLMKPCLFSELEYDIRKIGIVKAFEMAVENKPACGAINKINSFYNIGG